jgi:nicotinic acetylcholine receptor alpha-9
LSNIYNQNLQSRIIKDVIFTGEKITLGTTILLAFFVNSLVVSQYTPDAARAGIPVIGIYYIFNMGLVSLSTAASIYVLNLHYKGIQFLLVCDY